MKIQVRDYHMILIATPGRAVQRFQQAMSSRAGIATGWSADLTNAENVTQVGEVLRSEPDWHIAQDDIAFLVSATECLA
jgi:hypothetical protein